MGWADDCAAELARARAALQPSHSVIAHAQLTHEDDRVELRLQRKGWLLRVRLAREASAVAGEWHATRRRGFGEGDALKLHREAAGRTARLELSGPRGRSEALAAWEARFKAAADACLAYP